MYLINKRTLYEHTYLVLSFFDLYMKHFYFSNVVQDIMNTKISLHKSLSWRTMEKDKCVSFPTLMTTYWGFLSSVLTTVTVKSYGFKTKSEDCNPSVRLVRDCNDHSNVFIGLQQFKYSVFKLLWCQDVSGHSWNKSVLCL